MTKSVLVKFFAFHWKSPEFISAEDNRRYLQYVEVELKWSVSSLMINYSALKFFFEYPLPHDFTTLKLYRMASADFSTFNRSSLNGLVWPLNCGFIRVVETSPDKSDNFHPIYLVHLRRKGRAVLDFALFGELVRPAYA